MAINIATRVIICEVGWYGGTLEITLLFFISVTISIANVLDMSNAQVYGAWFEPMAGYDDNGATIYLSYRVHRNCTARARQVGLFSCDKSTVIAQCSKIYIVLTRTHSKG